MEKKLRMYGLGNPFFETPMFFSESTIMTSKLKTSKEKNKGANVDVCISVERHLHHYACVTTVL